MPNECSPLGWVLSPLHYSISCTHLMRSEYKLVQLTVDVAEDDEVGNDPEHSLRSHECFHEILVVSGYFLTPVVKRLAVGVPCRSVEKLV